MKTTKEGDGITVTRISDGKTIHFTLEELAFEVDLLAEDSRRHDHNMCVRAMELARAAEPHNWG